MSFDTSLAYFKIEPHIFKYGRVWTNFGKFRAKTAKIGVKDALVGTMYGPTGPTLQKRKRNGLGLSILFWNGQTS